MCEKIILPVFSAGKFTLQQLNHAKSFILARMKFRCQKLTSTPLKYLISWKIFSTEKRSLKHLVFVENQKKRKRRGRKVSSFGLKQVFVKSFILQRQVGKVFGVVKQTFKNLSSIQIKFHALEESRKIPVRILAHFSNLNIISFEVEDFCWGLFVINVTVKGKFEIINGK